MDISDIRERLARIADSGRLRFLPVNSIGLKDFSSNDYLGLSKDVNLRAAILNQIQCSGLPFGSGGSRLLSGNLPIWENLENIISKDFHSESALFFSSGFATNQGLLATIPQRGDLVLFDELVHASIRQGLRLSLAKTIKFKHNDFTHAEELIRKNKVGSGNKVYLIGESVYSMKGTGLNYKGLKELVQRFHIRVILDEAHTTGLWAFGKQGAAPFFLSDYPVFARIICFGKAYASQGAMILGSGELKKLLVNSCKEFIYTTASSPWLAITLASVHHHILNTQSLQETLNKRLCMIGEELKNAGFENSGNHPIKFINQENPVESAEKLKAIGFKVSAIRPPTVPEGTAGLRVSVNNLVSNEDCKELVNALSGL
jgi:8-amino-7-oxononanoate synthase